MTLIVNTATTRWGRCGARARMSVYILFFFDSYLRKLRRPWFVDVILYSFAVGNVQSWYMLACFCAIVTPFNSISNEQRFSFHYIEFAKRRRFFQDSLSKCKRTYKITEEGGSVLSQRRACYCRAWNKSDTEKTQESRRQTDRHYARAEGAWVNHSKH